MSHPNLVTYRRPPIILAGLLLALAFGLAAAGQTPAAQAARAADYSKQIYLIVTKAGSAERTICVGDKVEISARVLTVVDVLNDPNAERQFAALYGVPLQASVTDTGIGAISPASAVTTVGGDPVGQVKFTFTAQKPGATTIQVDGKLIHKQLLGVVLSSDMVTGKLALKVEKCAYRMDATAVWHIELTHGQLTLIAEITDAALAPTGDGTYAGNAEVKWFTKIPPFQDCHYATHPPPSRAHITGKMLDSGLLEVEVTWEQTPALAATFVCPKRSWEVFADHPIIPDPEQFWVPSTGGTSRRNPALTGAETTDGIAIYTIIPEPGQ